jgi:hypothetical protein
VDCRTPASPVAWYKAIVKILSFDWEPEHPPELLNSFEDSEGQLWEVWKVPE